MLFCRVIQPHKCWRWHDSRVREKGISVTSMRCGARSPKSTCTAEAYAASWVSSNLVTTQCSPDARSAKLLGGTAAQLTRLVSRKRGLKRTLRQNEWRKPTLKPV